MSTRSVCSIESSFLLSSAVVLQFQPNELITDLNLLFSGIAALAGFLILWFSVIRGPDIELVSTPGVAFGEAPSLVVQPFDYVVLKPMDLVFANNGSRSGVLVDIAAIFKPSLAFSKFYYSLSQATQVKSPTQEGTSAQLPIIIPERGTSIIALTVYIGHSSWKDVSRISGYSNLSLSEALTKTWREGKESLRMFSTLSSDLGTLEIRIRRTRRRLARLRISDDSLAANLRVGPLPDSARKRARDDLERFHEIPPTDYEVARSIRSSPEIFIGDIDRNISVLSKPMNKAGMQQISTQGWDLWVQSQSFGQAPFYVLMREQALMRMIARHYARVKEYNARIMAVAAGTPLDEREVNSIDKLRLELLTEGTELNKLLISLRQKLVLETSHLVEGGDTK
jgi:hypothetical protein